MDTYSYEDIVAKAEWEGGLDETLDWFKPNEVPSEIAILWETAKLTKQSLNNTLDLIWKHFPEELQ